MVGAAECEVAECKMMRVEEEPKSDEGNSEDGRPLRAAQSRTAKRAEMGRGDVCCSLRTICIKMLLYSTLTT